MKDASLALPLVIGVVLLIQVPGRGIDPDELEHVHAACAVSWGEVPYRDFFEHHGPGLYYLLQPILRMTGPELPALWWSRLLMWAAGMATLAADRRDGLSTGGKDGRGGRAGLVGLHDNLLLENRGGAARRAGHALADPGRLPR